MSLSKLQIAAQNAYAPFLHVPVPASKPASKRDVRLSDIVASIEDFQEKMIEHGSTAPTCLASAGLDLLSNADCSGENAEKILKAKGCPVQADFSSLTASESNAPEAIKGIECICNAYNDKELRELDAKCLDAFCEEDKEGADKFNEAQTKFLEQAKKDCAVMVSQLREYYKIDAPESAASSLSLGMGFNKGVLVLAFSALPVLATFVF